MSIKKYAWYFPNWHVTPLNEQWHGKGWTEWQCVKYATPRFEGHLQPQVPLWGYEDESDPKVFEKKIDTALSYGLDGFLFDFYWFKSVGKYRIDCLEKGFLGASNNKKCEFAVMLCNHDPIYVHPAPYMHKTPELLSGDVDAEFFEEVTQYCIDHYFPLENYIRIDGKVYFGIWNMKKFIDNFGGAEGAAEAIADFRKRCGKAGFELHFAANKAYLPYFREDKAAYNALVKQLGIDGLFAYGWHLPDSEDWPKVEYSEFREINKKINESDNDFTEVPTSVTVSLGFDCSPRTVQSDIYENTGYPYTAITVNNTTEEIEKAFRDAKEFIDSGKYTGKYMTVTTWNEWTEGNYLEPSKLYGYGYLEAFKKVFK